MWWHSRNSRSAWTTTGNPVANKQIKERETRMVSLTPDSRQHQDVLGEDKAKIKVTVSEQKAYSCSHLNLRY